MWIDSHCHLNHERNEQSAADIVQAARDAGVDGMVNISCEINGDFKDVLKTAQNQENVWCTVGTHPHDAGKPLEKATTLDGLIALANSDPNIIGIGESGLDYFYNYSPVDDQQDSFRKHIQACIATNLPIIIHARDADTDIARIMFEEEGAGTALKGVMHCFSSGAELAKQAMDFGFYMSFSGILTFKKADELREIAKTVPLDRLLVETDAPFLAPMPYRGKINQPAYVQHTGAVLADVHGITPEEMARITTDNFFTLFNKATINND